MNEKIDEAVTEIWQYMQVGDEVGSADCLIVLGSRDERVAVHAAELAVRHSYAHVVITGGSAHSNDLLATTWNAANEAEYFGSVMRSCGYTQPLLLETEALNTGQNATNTYALLKKQGITIKTAVLVTKPYMERRAKATFEVQWPDNAARFYVTSQQLSFADYINVGQPVDTVINIMVGDLQRTSEYPKLGFSSQQEMPRSVQDAFDVLVAAGYTKHLLP